MRFVDILWHVGDCIFPLARPLSVEDGRRETVLGTEAVGVL